MRQKLSEMPYDIRYIWDMLKADLTYQDCAGNTEKVINDYEVENAYAYLESLRDVVNETLAYIDTKVPLKRRMELLENVAGREPAEAASFLAKAGELRRQMEDDG